MESLENSIKLVKVLQAVIQWAKKESPKKSKTIMKEMVIKLSFMVL